MKGKKHKAGGGEAEGAKEWEADVKDKPQRYNDAPKIQNASEELKRGGKAKKRADGGKIGGAPPRANGGRAPRASGGRTGSNFNPLSSAHSGSNPAGHKTPGSAPYKHGGHARHH